MGVEIKPMPNCPVMPLDEVGHPAGQWEWCFDNCVAGSQCSATGWKLCSEGAGKCYWAQVYGWCMKHNNGDFFCHCFDTYTSNDCTAEGSNLALEPSGIREPQDPRNADTPRLLLFDYNLCDQPDTMMECFRREDMKPVLKFCNLKTPMNVKVLFDPDIYFS